MPDQTINCPKCSAEIALTETLSLQIKDQLRAEFEKKEQQQLEKMVAHEKILQAERLKLSQEREVMQKSVEEKVKAEKEKMWVVAQEKAQEKFGLELKDLKQQKEEREALLKEAQKHELELRAKTRELEEKTKNAELEIARKLDDERRKIEEKFKTEQSQQIDERMRLIQEDFRKRELEKDKQMEQMKKALDDAQRKSEQGSMQIQGEVQEADLKQLLSSTFPADRVEDVPTGINGADLIQTVNTNFGQKAGVVLWESKNTKQWSDDWVKKLKSDQALAAADISVLVTKALPSGVKQFGCVDGVWVLEYGMVLPVTSMLRVHLLQLLQTKTSLVGREEKKDYLYEYLSSAQFRNRIENIVLGFKSLKEDLETEKRSMQRIWSKREKEIERIVLSTTNFYGDVQGIIGASLQSVPALELEAAGDDDWVDESPSTQTQSSLV
jgi:hypothetical protein